MYIHREGLIALHQLPGVGWHTIQKLIQAGWSCENNLTRDMIERMNHGNKISSNVVKLLHQNWNGSLVSKLNDEFRRKNVGVLTILDQDYPSLLKKISQPPWVLYYRGDVSLLSGPAIAVVGTRRPTPYGLKVTQQFAEELSHCGWVIVSGMASGIDGVAHRSVLRAQGKTVAVLGSGIDVIYPKNHRALYEQLINEGLVLSEMPPGTKPHPGLFPQRNRIISGLSYGTVVIEAAEKSGSLITANYSLEEGREVFAIPGPITSDKSGGTNSLIQQGAKSVCKVEDILEEFPYISSVSTSLKNMDTQEKLSEQEKELLTYIDIQPISMTELLEKATGKLSIGEIHHTLLILETKGKIHQLPGSAYVLV